jgi:hypothetical protein
MRYHFNWLLLIVFHLSKTYTPLNIPGKTKHLALLVSLLTQKLFRPWDELFFGSAAQGGLWPPGSRGFVITHNYEPQSVGILWTNDHSVAETSTWQHTTHTTDKHPCHALPRLVKFSIVSVTGVLTISDLEYMSDKQIIYYF